MALRRQIRRIGRSLAITIPKDLADLYEVEEGDQAEFEPLGERTFRIKLVKTGEVKNSPSVLRPVLGQVAAVIDLTAGVELEWPPLPFLSDSLCGP